MMKKRYVLLVILMMSLLLTACGKQSGGKDGAGTQDSEKTSEELVFVETTLTVENFVSEMQYQRYVELLRAEGLAVETGVFQTHMLVELANDGPVTILLESKAK